MGTRHAPGQAALASTILPRASTIQVMVASRTSKPLEVA
ncbi:MAG: hypothetical protein AVDCRST_MAG90-2456 [uncultured Microvirga sp.]|uniref:Uncharacterized protein n=1 Tax=uncultured Microvirga sp. TaxID=412392 RepID=A0A6J4M7C8_9HYPH|nr:MAG: hypothetical protein AVDCRST_MAG90-2456 [uncultured Microvirga sp.]